MYMCVRNKITVFKTTYTYHHLPYQQPNGCPFSICTTTTSGNGTGSLREVGQILTSVKMTKIQLKLWGLAHCVAMQLSMIVQACVESLN